MGEHMSDKKIKPTTKELSDADLDKVAGGLFSTSGMGTEVKAKKKVTGVHTSASGNPEGFNSTASGSPNV